MFGAVRLELVVSPRLRSHFWHIPPVELKKARKEGKRLHRTEPWTLTTNRELDMRAFTYASLESERARGLAQAFHKELKHYYDCIGTAVIISGSVDGIAGTFLRREADNSPGVVLANVADAVVEAIGATLPEFNSLGD